MHSHSSDPPPPFLFLITSLGGGGGNLKNLKRRWKYGEGAGLLKKRGAGTFPFQGLSFLHLDINLLFAKLCYAFEEKLFFSATIILWKKSHSKSSKNEPEMKLIFDICLNPLIMCKEGWCVGLGQEGVAVGWGNYLKYLKRGWNRKEGKRKKAIVEKIKKGGRGASWVP